MVDVRGDVLRPPQICIVFFETYTKENMFGI